MTDAPRFLKIGAADTVAVALAELPAGTAIHAGGDAVTLAETIPPGHKFALTAHAPGDPVIKYDLPIGAAQCAIAPGERVHSHNLKTRLSGELEYRYDPIPAPALPPMPERRSFFGFRRTDGRCGIRNDLWILPTVGCVNKLAETLARRFERELPAGLRVC